MSKETDKTEEKKCECGRIISRFSTTQLGCDEWPLCIEDKAKEQQSEKEKESLVDALKKFREGEYNYEKMVDFVLAIEVKGLNQAIKEREQEIVAMLSSLAGSDESLTKDLREYVSPIRKAISLIKNK